MVGRLILRGFIVGIVAGLLAFGWAKVFGEPTVNTAIAFESVQNEQKAAAAVAAGREPEANDPEIFSRSVQGGIGLLTGIVAVGAGLGGMFAVLFAFANGRMGLAAGPTSVVLALLGLVTIYVIPFLKYPANPPAVGEPDTIQLRTGLYFLMLAISIAATVGALLARQSLMRRYGSWNGSILASAAYILAIAVVFLALPAVDEVPNAFSAVTLWNFRLASLGIQTVLWISIGVMFGYVGEQAAGSLISTGQTVTFNRTRS